MWPSSCKHQGMSWRVFPPAAGVSIPCRATRGPHHAHRSHSPNKAFPIFVLDAGAIPARHTVIKAVRPISIARLHGLLRFHLRPIDLVVFQGSLRGSRPTGELVLGGASRLDAFSVYPVRTWLLHVAPGGTMDTPEVRPTRSSRTRVSFLQLSNAHTG